MPTPFNHALALGFSAQALLLSSMTQMLSSMTQMLIFLIGSCFELEPAAVLVDVCVEVPRPELRVVCVAAVVTRADAALRFEPPALRELLCNFTGITGFAASSSKLNFICGLRFSFGICAIA